MFDTECGGGGGCGRGGGGGKRGALQLTECSDFGVQ